MIANLESSACVNGSLKLATFSCGDLVLGLDIDVVQEINRQLDVTRVPLAPSYVAGAINLRGDVVTVIDLRRVLGLAASQTTRASRNIIVRSGDELIGLIIDGVYDIVNLAGEDIDRPPANVNGIDGRYFSGVYTTQEQIIMILNLEQALKPE